ncbi:hypothetical protein ACJX0J_039051, partial [Zea mays]
FGKNPFPDRYDVEMVLLAYRYSYVNAVASGKIANVRLSYKVFGLNVDLWFIDSYLHIIKRILHTAPLHNLYTRFFSKILFDIFIVVLYWLYSMIANKLYIHTKQPAAALEADQARERERIEEQERREREAVEAEKKRKEEEEAVARAAQEAAEKEAALARRRQEKAMALGAEPEKGPGVTR